MRYLYGRDQLKLLVLLVDCRRQPLEADAAILNFAADNDLGFHVAVVATKVDKLSPMDRALNLSRIRDGFELPDQLPIPFSAVSGEGKNEVWQYIKDACNAREAKRDLKPPPFGLK
jgi:GTP-binding protein